VHRYDVPTQPDESFVDRLLHMHSIDNFTNPASGISLGTEDGLPLGQLVPPDMVQVLRDPSLLERLPDFGDTNWDEQIPWHSEEVVHHPPLFGDDVGANLAAAPHDGGDLFGDDAGANLAAAPHDGGDLFGDDAGANLAAAPHDGGDLFGDDAGANLAAAPHDGGDLFGDDAGANLAAAPHDGGDLFGDDAGANLAAAPHDGGDLFGDNAGTAVAAPHDGGDLFGEDQTPNDFGGDHTFSSCGGGDGLEFGNSGFENSFSGHVFDDFGSNAQLCGGEDAW